MGHVTLAVVATVVFAAGCSGEKKEKSPPSEAAATDGAAAAGSPSAAPADPSTMDKVSAVADRAREAAGQAGAAAAATGVIASVQVSAEMKEIGDKIAANAKETQGALKLIMEAKTDQARKLAAEKAKTLKAEAAVLKEKLKAATAAAAAAAKSAAG